MPAVVASVASTRPCAQLTQPGRSFLALHLIQSEAQPLVGFLNHGLQRAVLDDCEHRIGPGDGDDAPAVVFPHSDVTREEEPDAQFHLEGLMGELWIARAQDDVSAEFKVELRLQRGLHVDLSQDAKALLLQRVRNARPCILK